MSPTQSSSLIANEAMRLADRYEALVAARRFDEVIEMIGPDYTLVDHRFGGVTPAIRGRAGFLEQMRAYGAVGLRTVAHHHLATRGERLVLGDQVLESREGFVTTNLNLSEIDASGRFTRTDIFAEDDLDAALRALEEWYLEGEGAEHAFMVQRVGDERRAYAAGDGAAVAACYTTDAVIVNHRRLGWPMATPADIGDRVSRTRGIAEVNSTIGTHIECRGDASLAATDQLLTTPEGSNYSTVIIGVRHLTAGLFDVVEFFDLEDLAEARARFEELAVVPRNPTVDNRAARTLVRWSWLLRYGERRAADDLIADSIALVDRRLGVSLPAIEGRTAYHEAMAATSAVFPDLVIRPVAARGDRLALLNTIRSSDGFELSNLGLIETDRDGRVRLVTIFDLDARDAAVEELETRHLAIMGEDAAGERCRSLERGDRAPGPADRGLRGPGLGLAPRSIRRRHRGRGPPHHGERRPCRRERVGGFAVSRFCRRGLRDPRPGADRDSGETDSRCSAGCTGAPQASSSRCWPSSKQTFRDWPPASCSSTSTSSTRRSPSSTARYERIENGTD